MSDTKHGGPAFPLAYVETNEYGVQFPFTTPGMTLRDWFAGQVIVGVISHKASRPQMDAEYAYKVADAMLAAREVAK